MSEMPSPDTEPQEPGGGTETGGGDTGGGEGGGDSGGTEA